MFESNVALWLSSNNLAYLTFNDSMVHPIIFNIYGDFQYPITEAVYYPKAGTNNPIVNLNVYNIINKTIHNIIIPVNYE